MLVFAFQRVSRLKPCYIIDGVLIPLQGAIVLAKLWSVHPLPRFDVRSIIHNESKYPNSHIFLPELFLNDDGSLKPKDIEHIAFGFSRRICVGRHFADASTLSAIVKVLAVFSLETS